jgi:hypothetical protein
VRHTDANGQWSHWSAPIQFTVTAPDVTEYVNSLVVSEFLYNPSPATAAELTAGFASDSFEWIELKNVASQPVDMTGVRFTKGINFDFPAGWSIPAGGYALVVKNLGAFQSRYGNGWNAIIAGAYDGDNLRNEGEEIKLSFGLGTEIRSFTYQNTTPWPPEGDGSGASLVLLAPQTRPDHQVAANWRASMAVGGTPGGSDALLFAGNPLGDDDKDGWSNLVEYALGANPAISHELTDTLHFTIPRIPNADDAIIEGEVSTSLSGWVPAEVVYQDATQIQFRVPDDLIGEGRVFIRARVRMR